MTSDVNFVRPRLLIIATLLVSSLWLGPAGAEESEDRFVIGTGIVIGLAGTGDSEVDESLVAKSIVGVLKRAGLDVWKGQIEPGRIAKVIVTVELSPAGKALATTVTAIGDATSLAGGTLLATPLRYSDGAVQSMGQGRVVMKNDISTVDGERKDGDVMAQIQPPVGAK